jgi:hypothetical protein
MIINKIEQYLLDAIKNLEAGNTKEAHTNIDRARNEYTETVLIPAFNNGKAIDPSKDPVLQLLDKNDKDIDKGDFKESKTSILSTVDTYGKFLAQKFNETAIFLEPQAKSFVASEKDRQKKNPTQQR